MSVAQKLEELAALAEKLEEAKKAEEIVEAKEDKKSETEDEPEGTEKSDSEIETDDTEDSDSEDKEEIEESVQEAADLKIDLGNLFEGEELSEEFKTKATAVFEAAVAVRVKQELAEAKAALEEEYSEMALTESTELKESLVDKVDGYLDFMVEQWMKENELAINRGIKTEILESFVSGMKQVFESHYIDVPDEKYDLVEAAQQEAAELEQRLDEEVARNVELVGALKDIQRQVQIEEATVGMVATDAERFRQLAEELSFNDEFESKLQAIKESYFKSAPVVTESTQVIQEEFMTDTPVEVIQEAVKPALDPVMAAYVKALER